MARDATLDLTERQIEVAEGLGRHLTMKEIARELDISTSAVSKHVANLKRSLGANSHAEIVARFRDEHRRMVSEGVENESWQFFHLHGGTPKVAKTVSDDPGRLGFGDGADYPLTGDWALLHEPRVVPRWLDGENATTARLAAILVGMFLLVSTFVLSASAISSVSELVGGSPPDLALQEKTDG